MKNRKGILIPIVFIIILTSSLISGSELENTRLIDMAQLITLGMLLGVLIVNLKIIYLNKK